MTSGQRNFSMPVAALLMILSVILFIWAVQSFSSRTNSKANPAANVADSSKTAPPSNQPQTANLGGKSSQSVGSTGAKPGTNSGADAFALHEAAGRGDVDGIKAQLARGVDINAPLRGEKADRQGMTPLMSAVISAGPETVKFLLASKAKVDAQSDDGFTALMFASERGVAGNLQELLKAEANTDTANKAGETALMLAARSGSADKVIALLGAGASVSTRDLQGNTSLAFAASSNADSLVLKILLDAEADPTTPDLQGVSPLMKAVERGDLAKVLALLNKGADPTSKDSAGRTALDRARARTDTAGTQMSSVLTEAGDF